MPDIVPLSVPEQSVPMPQDSTQRGSMVGSTPPAPANNVNSIPALDPQMQQYTQPVPVDSSQIQTTPEQTVAAAPPPVASSAPNPAPSPDPQQQDNAESLLDILMTENVISMPQASEVKVKSAQDGMPIETVLAQMNIVPEDKIAEAKAKLLGVPYISLANTAFSPQALSLLPRAVVERFSLIPFFYDEKEGSLSIAMANPVDIDAIEFVRQKTGLAIKTFAASPTEVDNAIDQQYRQELVGEVGAAIQESEEYNQKKTIDSKKIAEIIKEAPIAKIVSTILEYAVTSRSSDVHIEPQEDRLRVRYRIDGILYDKLSLPKNVQEALISRIKILSDLKIDEHRSPQDGRFNFKVNDQEVDLRVSVLPTVNGEKIVMRLLRKSGGIPTLSDLGLNGVSLKALETAIDRPHGIILVCGPTGSGKTTTLYAVLSKLNTPKVNIMSLEDPVEYQMPGVNQIQVNPAVGLTFASGLRAFLRQDPNIILVGEIRDKETTDLALQAALTGHLVFSTLHTSNAAGALPRLLDLGAENFLLSSTINAIVGQRIVRKICPVCKEEYQPPPQVLAQLKNVLGNFLSKKVEDIKLYKGNGCNECGGSGYQGRIGIYEVMAVTDKIAKIVLEQPDSAALEKQAVADGMITMMQDGFLKVIAGITTIEEVLRVAKE
jgi:type IV pilus assembly protein PilB